MLLLVVAGVDASESQGMHVEARFEGDRLFLHARDASLPELIGELAAGYPFELRVHGELGGAPRDWRVNNRPLHEALRKLLDGHSLVMFFDAHEGGSSRLVRLEVYPGGQKSGRTDVTSDPAADVAASAGIDASAASVDQLQGMQDELSVQLLTDSLASSDSVQARKRSVELLAEIDSENSRAGLVTALGDADENVRKTAVDALLRWKSEESLQLLAQVMYGDESAEVRRIAVAGIAAHAAVNPDLVRTLLGAATGDRDESVAEAARGLADRLPPD